MTEATNPTLALNGLTIFWKSSTQVSEWVSHLINFFSVVFGRSGKL